MDEKTTRATFEKWLQALDRGLKGQPMSQLTQLEGLAHFSLEKWEKKLCANLGIGSLEDWLATDYAENKESDELYAQEITPVMLEQMKKKLAQLQKVVAHYQKDALERNIAYLKVLSERVNVTLLEKITLENSRVEYIFGDEPQIIDSDLELYKIRLRCLELAEELDELKNT